MLDLDEGGALILVGLRLGHLLFLEGFLGRSLDLLGWRLVGIVGIGTLESGLLALRRGGLFGGRLGRAGLAHNLLLDVSKGDGRRVGVLETGHLGKLLQVDLGRKTVNQDLAFVHDVTMADDAAARLREACWCTLGRVIAGQCGRRQRMGKQHGGGMGDDGKR